MKTPISKADPVDPAAALEFLTRKKQRRQKSLDQLYESATRDFEAIKSMLIERYSPHRIWQWGSLLNRSKFREYSDIDIAVEGVDDPEQFFKMFGDAERLTDFPLDLLDINKIAPEFAAIIKRKGVIVHEGYYFSMDYDWDRLNFLSKKLDRLLQTIPEDLNAFVDFLNRVVA